jgi:two-component system, NarL family, response regulator
LGTPRPQCLVTDPHPLVRLGVRESLRGDFDVHESESREEALALIRDVGDIDVAILHLRRCPSGSDGLAGADAIRAMRKAAPGLGIVAHGERADRHAVTLALQAGATAYVTRSATCGEMARAVKAALEQERFVDPAVPPKGSRGTLTKRQLQILQFLADGGSTTAAARQLDLSEETVKTHTKNALARLGARNRTHAVAIALRESLID